MKTTAKEVKTTEKILNCVKWDERTRTNKDVGAITLNVQEERAKLYFYGDIVSETWETEYDEESRCPQDIADFMAELKNAQSIDVYLNSGGGSINGGMAIYNILKRHPGHKTAYVDGLAASIASVIMFACDRIVVPKNSMIMIHKPMSFRFGNADEMRKCAEVLDNYQETIMGIYLEHLKEGVNAEQLVEMVNHETWMSGEKAAKVFDIETEEGIKAIASCSSHYFDRYLNTPRSLLSPPKPPDEADEKDKTLDRLQLELQLLCL